MKTNSYGEVTVTENEAFEALYSDIIKDLENVYIDNIDAISKYNESIDVNADRLPKLQSLIDKNIPLEDFDKNNQKQWFMPEDYCPNLVEMLYSLCSTPEETDRVSQELELFIQHGMIDLLHYLKYLVDTMRNNNIVWGVGRGSSVASYVLFLIGVHKVDSIKYNLDIREFLK